MDTAQRDTTVDDLNQFDIGRRVSFRRAGGGAGRPEILGKLLSYRETSYMRGLMPQRGFMVRVEYARAPFGSSTIDEHGPMAANHPITVGPPWHDRVDVYPDDEFDD